MSVRQGQKEADLAKQHNLVFKPVEGINRTDLKGVSPEIVQAAFDLPRPKKGEVTGQVVALPDGDFVTVFLQAVNDGDMQALSKEKREAFEVGLAQSLGELDYNLMVSDAYRTMKIKK